MKVCRLAEIEKSEACLLGQGHAADEEREGVAAVVAPPHFAHFHSVVSKVVVHHKGHFVAAGASRVVPACVKAEHLQRSVRMRCALTCSDLVCASMSPVHRAVRRSGIDTFMLKCSKPWRPDMLLTYPDHR